jgi:hypothetical protein
LIETPIISAPGTNAKAGCGRIARARRRLSGFETGDLLAQHRDEIARHVHKRLLDAEQKRVQVGLADAIADLARQARVELVFRHRLQPRPAVVGHGVFEILGHVHGHRRDGNLVNPLPRPLEVRSARRDHSHLRIRVARPLLGRQKLGDGSVERRLVARQAVGSPENRLDASFVLVHRVDPKQDHAHEEPDQEADDDATQYSHSARTPLSAYAIKALAAPAKIRAPDRQVYPSIPVAAASVC